MQRPVEMLRTIIERGRSYVGAPKLPEDSCLDAAIGWHEFLQANKVPEDRYWQCFEEFMCSAERQARFTVYDLRDAWLRIKQQEKSPDNISANDRLCGGCHGTGWALNELVVDGQGKRSWRPIKWSGGYSGARPCICAKGRQFDRSYKKAAAANRALPVYQQQDENE